MFPDLSKFTEPDKLRKLLFNARRLGHHDYAFEIHMRIAELAGLPFEDALEREFWTAVSYAEEVKTEENGRTTRLLRTRQKHKRAGAIQCLVDWAVDPATTDGFAVLVEHGRPDLTGEAIVIRHADKFPADAVAKAAAKLAAHGISREQLV
ncbi:MULTISPECIES: hypothetical protein [unclassified Devosia]|uniref:hypothetical protein n=1 Tax=unclassified Devosia TaxID=196773 RepID=UPI000869204D|nr:MULTISPECIES: hypothetical protein [unclassified Devosia]MBN9362311.1 hypothetical protein [Devosia sp.]ODS93495.1 MAG: hypothetical protein ABS47_06985 [Devosia sp. SCN 66-27]OJX24447.1 MAG: hypothetical protein BGO83_07425 [Devosia sp. 66-14]